MSNFCYFVNEYMYFSIVIIHKFITKIANHHKNQKLFTEINKPDFNYSM